MGMLLKKRPMDKDRIILYSTVVHTQDFYIDTHTHID